jgi:hypothetical protein
MSEYNLEAAMRASQEGYFRHEPPSVVVGERLMGLSSQELELSQQGVDFSRQTDEQQQRLQAYLQDQSASSFSAASASSKGIGEQTTCDDDDAIDIVVPGASGAGSRRFFKIGSNEDEITCTILRLRWLSIG